MSLAHEIKTEMIKELVLEIIIFLKQNSSSLEKKKILDLITLINLDQQNTNYQKSSKPPKSESIKDALSSIHCGKLLPIKKAISLTLNQLQWNIDDGEFYRKNSKIGHNYLNGNMNTELIGPNKGFFKSKELRLGLFLLQSNIFYKDHYHASPELYLNLTNGTKWRFKGSTWRLKKAGSIVFNPPFRSHAMLVADIPFLSVWCWPHSSSGKCVLTY